MTIAYGISPRQIKAIHALVHKLGWDDDTYRLMLKERYQVATCKALSYARATLLVDELKAKAGQRSATGPEMTPARPVTARRKHTWSNPPQPPFSKGGRGGGFRGAGTITPKQQALIDALFTRLGWDQRRRDGFCRKLLGRPWPQTNAEVTRLLNLLRAMGSRYPGGYDRSTGGDAPRPYSGTEGGGT